MYRHQQLVCQRTTQYCLKCCRHCSTLYGAVIFSPHVTHAFWEICICSMATITYFALLMIQASYLHSFVRLYVIMAECTSLPLLAPSYYRYTVQNILAVTSLWQPCWCKLWRWAHNECMYLGRDAGYVYKGPWGEASDEAITPQHAVRLVSRSQTAATLRKLRLVNCNNSNWILTPCTRLDYKSWVLSWCKPFQSHITQPITHAAMHTYTAVSDLIYLSKPLTHVVILYGTKSFLSISAQTC